MARVPSPDAPDGGTSQGDEATLLAGLAPLSRCSNAYQAELGASMILAGAYADADPDIRVSVVEAFVKELVTRLVRQKVPVAVIALAGLASVSPPSAAAEAAKAVRGLAHQVPTAPSWVAEMGRVECTGAWTMRDTYGDITQYLATFSYLAGDTVGGPEHIVSVRVDNNLGVVLDAAVAAPAAPVLQQARNSSERGDISFAEIDPAVMRADVAQAAARADELSHPPGGQSYIQQWALVMSRVVGLPGTAPPSRPLPLSEPGRDEVVAEFSDSPEGQIKGPEGVLPQSVVVAAAREAVDFAVDFNSGDPLRWSPAAVKLFLVKWMPYRTDVAPEVLSWLPEVLDALVGYAGRIRELPSAAVASTRRTIEECSAEYSKLMLANDPLLRATLTEAMVEESSGPPPAAEEEGPEIVMARMAAEGVDLTDEDQMRRWLTDYYSRLDEQDADPDRDGRGD